MQGGDGRGSVTGARAQCVIGDGMLCLGALRCDVETVWLQMAGGGGPQLSHAADGAREHDVLRRDGEVLNACIQDTDIGQFQHPGTVTEKVRPAPSGLHQSELTHGMGNRKREGGKPTTGANIEDSSVRVQGDLSPHEEGRENVVGLKPGQIGQADKVQLGGIPGQLLDVTVQLSRRLGYGGRIQPGAIGGDALYE